MARCDNPFCCVSTAITECLTFGYGELDSNGFWEHPCKFCALDWWFNRRKELIDEMAAEGNDYYEHEWLFLLPWPLSENDLVLGN